MVGISSAISMNVIHAIIFFILKTLPRSVFVFLLIILFSCSSKTDTTTSFEKFPVTHPAVMDTVFTKEYVAEIQSVQNVELRSRVKGFIEAIHADEGKPVKEGQILFTISSQEFNEETTESKCIS